MIDLRRIGDLNFAVVTLPTKLDTTNAVEVRSMLSKVIDWGHYHLFLDSRSVTFLDSSGLGTLVAIFKVCRQKYGSLTLFGLSGNPALALQLSGLDSLLLNFATEEEAITNLQVKLSCSP
ncbi:STAS domain-containing protein [Leptolyngbya sp. FACHB-261]|uniref:STAS domain-containing protein n=1 Tax=Leptolyngbya sp. FACHB-261 TaxID=2692806 RepID=UPI001688BC9F|nr:STAS domain-containing protein [Leptolyngbya sp. FACHB-261]MBD2101201.1 STAS domain-containing protein [Leptolyngbya sp. FACHB-261]